MRKLILAILLMADEPLEQIELMRIALIDDNADYFLFADALTGLTEAGLTLRTGSRVVLTSGGEELAAIVTDELPAALRRVAAEGSATARDAKFRARCIQTETKEADGAFYFAASLSDGNRELLTLRMQTADRKQAEKLGKIFEEKAEDVLRLLWETLYT
jgi:hypothetical protein